jgi:hypothetical protein
LPGRRVPRDCRIGRGRRLLALGDALDHPGGRDLLSLEPARAIGHRLRDVLAHRFLADRDDRAAELRGRQLGVDPTEVIGHRDDRDLLLLGVGFLLGEDVADQHAAHVRIGGLRIRDGREQRQADGQRHNNGLTAQE